MCPATQKPRAPGPRSRARGIGDPGLATTTRTTRARTGARRPAGGQGWRASSSYLGGAHLSGVRGMTWFPVGDPLRAAKRGDEGSPATAAPVPWVPPAVRLCRSRTMSATLTSARRRRRRGGASGRFLRAAGGSRSRARVPLLVRTSPGVAHWFAPPRCSSCGGADPIRVGGESGRRGRLRNDDRLKRGRASRPRSPRRSSNWSSSGSRCTGHSSGRSLRGRVSLSIQSPGKL